MPLEREEKEGANVMSFESEAEKTEAGIPRDKKGKKGQGGEEEEFPNEAMALSGSLQ